MAGGNTAPGPGPEPCWSPVCHAPGAPAPGTAAWPRDCSQETSKSQSAGNPHKKGAFSSIFFFLGGEGEHRTEIPPFSPERTRGRPARSFPPGSRLSAPRSSPARGERRWDLSRGRAPPQVPFYSFARFTLFLPPFPGRRHHHPPRKRSVRRRPPLQVRPGGGSGAGPPPAAAAGAAPVAMAAA